MPRINLIDAAGILSPAEFIRLKSFLSDNCLCGYYDLKMLRHVALRDDGASGYSSYWTARFMFDGKNITDIQSVIILNTFYLKTITRLKKALAHEFGHHWTLVYLMDRREMIHTFNERAPRLYYRIRGLDPEVFAKDYSKGWACCDKEVLAEDYRYAFSPCRDKHRMAHLAGHPSAEVTEYIRGFGSPIRLV